MKTIFLDCFAGISGNMMLGALVDAGVPEAYLRDELAKLPLHNEYTLLIDRTSKCGISAIYVDVELAHQHEHAHDHHHHRHLSDIVEMIDSSLLSHKVKDTSKKIFLRLAQAEATVHGTTIDKIHFHEVGAVDSIIDIVGTAIGLDYLQVERICTSRLQVGTGFVTCDHGIMPVPAPATAELLRDIPYYSGDIAKELVTPTGAAIIAALGTGYGKMPENFQSRSIAYGAGTWDLEIPNVVRLHIGEMLPTAANYGNSDIKYIVEANIDDLNPQVYEYVIEKLLAHGALDVWLTPIIMKKSRPATTLSTLVNESKLEEIQDIIFTETSTIGLRYYEVNRIAAEREIIPVQSDIGSANVKVSRHLGKICNISPEYEDCKKLAQERGVSLKEVQQIVIQAAKDHIFTK